MRYAEGAEFTSALFSLFTSALALATAPVSVAIATLALESLPKPVAVHLRPVLLLLLLLMSPWLGAPLLCPIIETESPLPLDESEGP